MSGAVVMAFAAACCGVAAAWEAAGSVDQAAVAGAAARLLAPWRAAGRGEASAAGAAERRRLGAVLAACLLAGGWLLAGPVLGLVAAAIGPWVLGRLLARRRARWRAALAAGAPAVARAMADALAAGRSIRGALAEAASSAGAGAAASAELRAAAAALRLGEPTEDVLERMRARASAPAWDTLTAAVLLQRDAGGDLAGLLRAIAADLEAAKRTEADARAATAQARFTARLVAGLPLAAALLAELAHPGTLQGIASTPLSATLAGCALALELIALAVVNRLARLELPA